MGRSPTTPHRTLTRRSTRSYLHQFERTTSSLILQSIASGQVQAQHPNCERHVIDTRDRISYGCMSSFPTNILIPIESPVPFPMGLQQQLSLMRGGKMQTAFWQN